MVSAERDGSFPHPHCQHLASRVPEVVEALAKLGITRPAAEGLMSAPRWAMAQALRELDEAHGGIRRYLLGPAGLTPPALDGFVDERDREHHDDETRGEPCEQRMPVPEALFDGVGDDAADQRGQQFLPGVHDHADESGDGGANRRSRRGE